MRFQRLANRVSILSIALVALSAPLGAATYFLTTLVEDTDVNGNCTLREALLAAADDATHDLCIGDAGADEIVLQESGVYQLDDGPIVLSGRQLWVHGDLTGSQGNFTIDLGGGQRFLEATNGSDLTVERLTLLDGASPGRGGAISAVDSDLTLRRVDIQGSFASRGGAISFEATNPRTLDLEQVELLQNGAEESGGALDVDLAGGGTVRLVAMRIAGNAVTVPAAAVAYGVPVERHGGGLRLTAAGAVAIELRHLDLTDNSVDAPSGGSGGGAAISVAGSGSIVAEDLRIVGNFMAQAVDGNDAPGLDLDVLGPSLVLRRLEAIANSFGNDKFPSQVRIDVGTGTAATLSDLAVVSGNSSGLHLGASGSNCSLLAGSLTVAGHALDGLTLTQAGCTLRVENSIVAENAFVGFLLPLELRLSGSPEVSAETQAAVGVDPPFADVFVQDYSLAAGSEAIDGGDQSFASVGPFDAGHGTRRVGADVDLGAYEFGAVFAHDFEDGDRYDWSLSAP